MPELPPWVLSPDPAVVERQAILNQLGIADDPNLSISQLRAMSAHGANVYLAANQAAPDILNQLGDTRVTALINNAVSAAGSALRTLFAKREAAPRPLTDWGVSTTNTGAQNAAAFALAAAAANAGTVKRFILPDGTYPILMNDGSNLMAFSGVDGVEIIGSGNATLVDSTAHSNNGPFTTIFHFTNCKNWKVRGVKYVGPVLATPATLLGYQGAIFVRAVTNCRGGEVEAEIQNARYGFQTGDYANPALGGCSGFKITIKGSMIGYPVAAYNASQIWHDLDVDGIHRVAYIAGCDTVRGIARWKDQYIAPIAYLITDSLTSGTDAAAQIDPVGAATTSRASTNVKIASIDKGSTVFQNTSVCAGIALSRVDPMQYENIDVTVYSKATNVISTKVGGFVIVSSGVGAIWSRYAQGWNQNVIIDGVTVRGIVDHSAVSNGDTGNTTGELYINTWDDVAGAIYYATVRRLNIEGFTLLKSPASVRPIMICWREPSVPVRVAQLNAPLSAVTVLTSTAVTTLFENCNFETLNLNGAIASLVTIGQGCTINRKNGSAAVRVMGRGIGKAGPELMQKEVLVNLAGANVTVAGFIPGGALMLGIQGVVTQTITGATGCQVGVTGDLGRFRNGDFTAVGSTFGPNGQAVGTNPLWYIANTDVIITARTANFTGGQIRLVVTYMQYDTALTV